MPKTSTTFQEEMEQKGIPLENLSYVEIIGLTNSGKPLLLFRNSSGQWISQKSGENLTDRLHKVLKEKIDLEAGTDIIMNVYDSINTYHVSCRNGDFNIFAYPPK